VSGFVSGRAVVVDCFDDLQFGKYELALRGRVGVVVAEASYLLGRLDGDGVLLWDGDLHWFGGVVLVTLRKPELFVWTRSAFGGWVVRPRSVALLRTRHTLTMAGPWAALLGRGAVRERNKQWILWVEPASQGLH